jgi:hypothetical protein
VFFTVVRHFLVNKADSVKKETISEYSTTTEYDNNLHENIAGFETGQQLGNRPKACYF